MSMTWRCVPLSNLFAQPNQMTNSKCLSCDFTLQHNPTSAVERDGVWRPLDPVQAADDQLVTIANAFDVSAPVGLRQPKSPSGSSLASLWWRRVAVWVHGGAPDA